MSIQVRNTPQKVYVSTADRHIYNISTYNENNVLHTNMYKNDSKLKIILYNKEYEVTAEWLYLYAKLKIRIPTKYVDRVLDNNNLNLIVGDRLNTHLRIPYLAWFDTPIEFKYNGEIYRVIPDIPTHAITTIGKIMEIETGYICAEGYDPIKKVKYPAVTIGNNIYQIHRLVAITWVDNDDRLNKVVVDHINCDKTNFTAENLQWVTTAENNKRAIENGQNPQATKCVIRNLHNGMTRIFSSLTDLCRYYGRSRINTNIVALTSGRPYIVKIGNAYYQIKYEADTIDWVNLDQAMQLYKSKIARRYILTVGDKEFNTIEQISNFINNGKKYISLTDAIAYIENELKLKTELRYEDDDKKVDFIAHNVKTDEVFYSKTLQPFITLTGNAKSNIYKSMVNNGKYIYNDWRYKHDDGNDFSELNKIFNKPKGVTVYNTVNRTESTFNSIREAARYFEADPKTIRAVIDSNRVYKGKYKIKMT